MRKDIPANTLDRHQAVALLRAGKLQDAALVCAQLCTQTPGDFAAWLLYGLCLRQLGQLDRAIGLLERAAGLQPRSPEANYMLGQAYQEKGLVEPAIEHLSRALELKDDYAEAHDALTMLLDISGRFHEAVAACRRATGISPDAAEIHCRLASALEKTHQLDEARASVQQALNIDPGSIRARYISAKLDGRTGNLHAARDRLDSLTRLRLPPAQLATIHAELGDVLDRMGEYGQAFGQYLSCNDKLAGTVSREQATGNRLIDRVRNLQTYFTDESIRREQASPPADGVNPPVFLVGFPRSGTTLTEQVLASVDGITPSDEKPFINRLANELPRLLGRPFRYPDDLHTLDSDEIRRLRQRYWQLVGGMLRPLDASRRLLDKLPLNLIDIGLINRIFPDAKIIVVLRDPRDCCLSCFMQPFQPNQAMINFLSLERSARFYATVMELWLQYRSALKLDFIELRYEDLVEDFEAQARRLLDFLGEPWDSTVLRYFEHAEKRNITTPSYSAVAAPIYSRSLKRWKNYKAYLEPVHHALEPYIAAFGYA